MPEVKWWIDAELSRLGLNVKLVHWWMDWFKNALISECDVCELSDEWVDGLLDGRIDKWSNGKMDDWINEWMNGHVNGRTYEWIDMWMDGRILNILIGRALATSSCLAVNLLSRWDYCWNVKNQFPRATEWPSGWLSRWRQKLMSPKEADDDDDEDNDEWR